MRRRWVVVILEPVFDGRGQTELDGQTLKDQIKEVTASIEQVRGNSAGLDALQKEDQELKLVLNKRENELQKGDPET